MAVDSYAAFSKMLSDIGFASKSDRTKQQEELTRKLAAGLQQLTDSAKSEAFGTITPASNEDALELLGGRNDEALRFQGGANRLTNDYAREAQGIATEAKTAQRDNVTDNSLRLIQPSADVLNRQITNRSENLDKAYGFSASENAADRELRKRGMTQDLITKLALGAAIAFG
jgi:hypothetical protein